MSEPPLIAGTRAQLAAAVHVAQLAAAGQCSPGSLPQWWQVLA
jgi:hypothetical protein